MVQAAPADQLKSVDDTVASSDLRFVSAAENKIIQAKQPYVSQTVLVLGLLCGALACLGFWNLNRPKPKTIDGVIVPAPTLEWANAVAAKVDHEDTDHLSVPKKLAHRNKVSRPRTNLPIIATKRQLAPLTVSTAAAPVMAALQIRIEHQFAKAVASVWLDNVLVYTRPLEGDKKRHALVFQQVVGQRFDIIKVAMGKHEVRVRVQSDTESYDRTKTIANAFIRDEGTLHILCDKKHADLQLTLQ